jgi:hypothetical protein
MSLSVLALFCCIELATDTTDKLTLKLKYYFTRYFQVRLKEGRVRRSDHIFIF